MMNVQPLTSERTRAPRSYSLTRTFRLMAAPTYRPWLIRVADTQS
jgi:hypothetical protein